MVVMTVIAPTDRRGYDGRGHVLLPCGSVSPTFANEPRGANDTSERGNTGHARARPVRRVQPGAIRLVERGFLTDEGQDDGSDLRFTPSRRATRAEPNQLRARDHASGGSTPAARSCNRARRV